MYGMHILQVGVVGGCALPVFVFVWIRQIPSARPWHANTSAAHGCNCTAAVTCPMIPIVRLAGLPRFETTVMSRYMSDIFELMMKGLHASAVRFSSGVWFHMDK